MTGSADLSQAGFFRFLEQYKALIMRHVPGHYNFEYDSRLYMLPVHKHLAQVAALTPPGGRILDLGCGRGHFSAYLAQQGFQVEGYEVADPRAGDDFLHNQDPSTITHYPALWADVKATYGCDCHYYDGSHFPAADASFDTVLFYASFEHVPVEHIRSAVAESFRVLKPGGRAFVYRCPSSWAWKEHLTRNLGMGAHEKLYGKGEALGILKDAGFRLQSFERSDFFPAHVGPIQSWVNAAAPAFLALEAPLRWTPLAYLFHHFEIVLVKP
jgi:SAM-dependent methyltransferase